MNEYQKKYEELICFRQCNPVCDDYTEQHHIKPRSLYPKLISDPTNIVCLKIDEHILAHKYLMLWFKDVFGKNSQQYMKMHFAYHLMVYFNGVELSIKDAAKLKKEHIRLMSIQNTGENNPMYGHSNEEFMTPEAIIAKNKKISDNQTGTKCMTHPNLDHKMIRVKLEDVPKYLEQGYTFYKFPSKPLSQQTKNKLSKALKGKPSSNKGKPSKLRGKKLTDKQKQSRKKLMQKRGTNKHSEESRKRHSAANSKNIKGRIHLIHPITLAKKFPKKTDMQKYLDLGYITSIEYTRIKHIT